MLSCLPFLLLPFSLSLSLSALASPSSTSFAAPNITKVYQTLTPTDAIQSSLAPLYVSGTAATYMVLECTSLLLPVLRSHPSFFHSVPSTSPPHCPHLAFHSHTHSLCSRLTPTDSPADVASASIAEVIVVVGRGFDVSAGLVPTATAPAFSYVREWVWLWRC